MQSRKQLKRGAGRRRGGEAREEEANPEVGERPATSSNIPTSSTTAAGERNTRHDPVPREEHLTDEDWAIMAAVRIA